VWVISDLNGEPYRAIDWGNALVRRIRALAEPVLWCPALWFGDTGAASGAVALCLAARAFERSYAPAPWSLVLSSADGPDRAAVIVTADAAAASVH
jgi:3-oxoacyl-[acyl-carrier-protein] synthase-1